MKVLPPPPAFGSSNLTTSQSILGNPKKFLKITKHNENITKIFEKLFQDNELKIKEGIEHLSTTMIQTSLEHVRIISPPSTVQWDIESVRCAMNKNNCPTHERENGEKKEGLQLTPREAQMVLSDISSCNANDNDNIFYQLFLKSLTSPDLPSRRIVTRLNI